ncbi:MAG: XRE family transcriptional regulator [Ruminococcaceae bacterium]|nr:XRE family transcriptional regulator [Oscillospiraceae bacterium]
MIYEIKLFDEVVLRFSADDGAENNIKVLWVHEDKTKLPLDLSGESEADVWSWIRHRTIPRNRAYVDSLLTAMGLSPNRHMDIIKISKGLSLNDCYWVVEEGFEGTFDKYNLYDNRFSRVLGLIAFTGYGSDTPSGMTSSPEFTTNGILPKCWRRENGIKLYKGGTEGASNTGNEPYSEFYAYQIGVELGVNVIPYTLSKWKGRLCSVCDIFTSKELSYVPIGRIVKSGGLKAVREFYESLGEEFTKALNDMILFDAVIFNTDRHYGNFGPLVDSKTNKIVAPAPLFDHGNALFSLAGRGALGSDNGMKRYADVLLPCVYDSFVEEAKKNLTHDQKIMLRKLLDFKFKKHSRYNLPENRLSLIENRIHDRVREIIG